MPKDNYTAINCEDCSEEVFIDTNGIMIKDDLWKKIGMKPSGILCDKCIAKRLGRPIAISDFRPSTIPGHRWPLMNYFWLQNHPNTPKKPEKIVKVKKK